MIIACRLKREDKVFKSEQIVCPQRILNQIKKLRASEEKIYIQICVEVAYFTLSDNQLYVNLDNFLEGPKVIWPPYKIIGGGGGWPLLPPPPCSYAYELFYYPTSLAKYLAALIRFCCKAENFTKICSILVSKCSARSN